MAVGLVLMYSTSSYNGLTKFHDRFYYLKKQGFATILGLVGMFVTAGIDYHKWSRFAPAAYVSALALSVAVLFVGKEYNGSEKMAVFRSVFFSAVGICKGGGYPVPGMDDRATDQKDRKIFYHDPIVSSGTSHCRSGRGKQPEYGNYYSGNRRDPDLYGKSEIRAVPVDGGCRGRISGDFSGDWKVIAWSGWRSGGIRNSLKKGIRRCRDFMPSVPAVCSGRGWARAFRSWDFFQKRRMI